MLLDALFHCREGSDDLLLKNVMQGDSFKRMISDIQRIGDLSEVGTLSNLCILQICWSFG
jgi:hypothetical protein